MIVKNIFHSKIFWITTLLLSVISFLVLYHLTFKTKRVNNNIAKLEKIISGHSSVVWKVAFSPTDSLLASASADSTAKIWKRDGTIYRELRHPEGVTCLDYSPDGRYIVTGSYDGICRLWEVYTGALLREFRGHKGTVWSIDFNRDGKTFASSGEDATIRIWDMDKGGLLHTLKAHTLNVWCIKFSPDGTRLASGSFDHSVKIWNWRADQLVRNIEGHSEAVVELAYSHSGHQLATTSDDKTIKLWSTVDFKQLHTFTTPEHTQAVAFSPDDKYLLTGGRDKPMLGEFLQNFLGDSEKNKGVSARLWDITSGKLLQTFAEHANDVNDVAWSADGQWLATASSDRMVHLWKFNDQP